MSKIAFVFPGQDLSKMGRMQSGNCPIAYEKAFCYNKKVRWEF